MFNHTSKLKEKIAPEHLTDFLPCGMHLLGHWHKNLKASLWSHSCEAKIIIPYLWATVCLLLMRASSSSVQRGSAASWGYDRKPGLTKDTSTCKHPAIPCFCSRDLGIAWGIIGTSKFTQRGRLQQGAPSLYKVTVVSSTWKNNFQVNPCLLKSSGRRGTSWCLLIQGDGSPRSRSGFNFFCSLKPFQLIPHSSPWSALRPC